MVIILAVLFIGACLGLYLSIFSSNEENSESQFRVYFIPSGGTFEYDTKTGEGVLRDAYPGDWVAWDRLKGGYIRRFKQVPDWITVDENGDLVRYGLDPSGKAVELYRDSYF